MYADVVSLLCMKNAKEGGHSSWSSSITVYNEILKQRPDLAHLLAGPWFFDRKGEVPEGKQGFFEIPVFNFHVISASPPCHGPLPLLIFPLWCMPMIDYKVRQADLKFMSFIGTCVFPCWSRALILMQLGVDAERFSERELLRKLLPPFTTASRSAPLHPGSPCGHGAVHQPGLQQRSETGRRS